MPGFIPEHVIEAVRNTYDIVDVVSKYVHLKKSGRNYFGLCPFHNEKTPSFSVSPDKQIFHCFGCGIGGNVISFYMEVEGLTFVEAVQQLAQEANILIPAEENLTVDETENREKHLMYEALDLMAKVYHHLLINTDHGRQALKYLYQRGFSADAIKEFQIGYAPSSWEFALKYLQKKDFPLPLMEKAGILTSREKGHKLFDRFRHRIMFPIWDGQGRTVGFGGRILGDGQPKYLNSPENLLFNKGKLLFNLHRARKEIRKKQQAVLFEGYVDTIAAWGVGVENGVATLGTSLTDDQARLIRRNAEQVILCYDGDQAGKEAAYRGINILQEAGCLVKVAVLPPGMDPDDYIRAYGGEKFLGEIIHGAVSSTAFIIGQLRSHYDLKDEAGRMKYIRDSLKVIAKLPYPLERDHYLRELSTEFQLSLDALKQELTQVIKRQKKEKERDNPNQKWNNSINAGKRLVASTLLPAHQKAERILLGLMIRDAEFTRQIEIKVGSQFAVEEHAALAAHLYRFYTEHPEAEMGQFIHQLTDPGLLALASELVMMELNEEVTQQEIDDCVRQILNYPKWLEIEALKEEIKKAERMGDAVKAAQYGLELVQLKRSLKESEQRLSQGRRE
ncbi:DNA primase [Microaerobacter geothermalis]|uniref:DNA primase n=1 Tax=Microaerobacter geothermalis TaxID=674972 RepID=UPI001F201D3C|nr:DNA primase [Microaerobacter geothermalis]MCF6092785.1 DNA primase [Microaerobacter geothermalis]